MNIRTMQDLASVARRQAIALNELADDLEKAVRSELSVRASERRTPAERAEASRRGAATRKQREGS